MCVHVRGKGTEAITIQSSVLVHYVNVLQSVADTAATVRRDSTSEQPQGSGHAPEPSRNEMGTDKSGRGIQPLHIREAMRRLSIPSGPLLPLAVSIE